MSLEEKERDVVRSSELDTGLSTSDKPVKTEVDTATSRPSSSKPSSTKPSSTKVRTFHALKESCGLDADTLFRFRDKFQFPNNTRICLPRPNEKACAFAHGKVCFYEVAFFSGLKFPIHLFIMELLHRLNIALG